MSRTETMTKHEDVGTRAATREAHWRNVVPVCDIYENADEYMIVAEMPGVDERGIDIRLDRTRLTIEARRPTPADAGERPGGTRFIRTFEVPASIDAARVGAQIVDGLLSVRLPKAPEAQMRRIPVTAA